MSTWRKICCAVDPSGTSGAAVREACELARATGADLTLLQVIRGRAAREALFAPPPAKRVRIDTGQELASCLRDAHCRAPGRVKLVVLSGAVTEEIVRFAREFGIDLIVMGTHDQVGIPRRLARRSVTQEVIRRAPCPVIVVNSAAAPPPQVP